MDSKRYQSIIIGGGISGLVLANCFIKRDISFILLEGKEKIESMHGSHITLFPNSLKLFNQLGLLDDIQTLGTKLKILHFWNNGKFVKTQKIVLGDNDYDVIVIKRSDLMLILWMNINHEYIEINKKVTQIYQDENTVSIYCKDGSHYEGDFLIGADGAWSITRSEMYKQIINDGNNLPNSDKAGLKSSYIAISVTTKPLPDIVDDSCAITYTDNYKVTSYFLQKDKTIGFYFGYKTELSDEKNMLRWKDIKKEDIIKEIGNERTPFIKNNNENYTLGDIIENSEFIVKVNLEDKLFETWYYKRIVIIGDAAHKMLPWAGQGANQAIEDAVVLTNCLLDVDFIDLDTAFNRYVTVRKPRALEAVNASRMSTKMLTCETFLWYIIYQISINYLYTMIKQPWQKMINYQPILNPKKMD